MDGYKYTIRGGKDIYRELRASLARIEKYREEEREHLETIRNLEEQLRQQDQETVDLLAKALEERRRKWK